MNPQGSGDLVAVKFSLELFEENMHSMVSEYREKALASKDYNQLFDSWRLFIKEITPKLPRGHAYHTEEVFLSEQREHVVSTIYYVLYIFF